MHNLTNSFVPSSLIFGKLFCKTSMNAQTPETLKLPNIGDFNNVEVIEVLVKPGDKVETDAPLITLESDKASMDIPAPAGGTIIEVLVKAGETVSQGDSILTWHPAGNQTSDQPTAEAASTEVSAAYDYAKETSGGSTNVPPTAAEQAESAAPAPSSPLSGATSHPDITTDVLVIGAGPGGYTAAFRASDLGLKTVLLEKHDVIGGVCLNVGCIPSKALLHAARLIRETDHMRASGLDFGSVRTDVRKLRTWTEGIISQLGGGLSQLAAKRKVSVIHGAGEFISPNQVRVQANDGKIQTINFQHAIIATGSRAIRLPDQPQDERILDSTSALDLKFLPQRLLVIGGGIIGMEMATIYSALRSNITVVEMTDQLLGRCDAELIKPLRSTMEKKQGVRFMLNTKVDRIDVQSSSLQVTLTGDETTTEEFDAILVAVGRRPDTNGLGLTAAGVHTDDNGLISVDGQQRTNVPHIYAIGDIVGQPMLAHKATHEGKVAAEVIAGHKVSFDNRVIPLVAYTDPEVAWVGLTETEAKEQGIDYGKGVFPWMANGRSLTLNQSDGLTRMLFDKSTGRLLGLGIVGSNAGDLIGEGTLALEMGCDAEDIGLTIHPHPTLSETIGMAAEAYSGTLTDLYMPRR